MMKKGAAGRLKPCTYAKPDSTLPGTPDEKTLVCLPFADGNKMTGVLDSDARFRKYFTISLG
jgi:hypothetical protein